MEGKKGWGKNTGEELVKSGQMNGPWGEKNNPGEEMARGVRRNSGNGDILEAKARENYKEGVASSIKYHRLG